MSSHDVVNAVRRALGDATAPGRLRVGHAGTLDPFATGLLLVLVGRATRVQRYLMALPKTYQVVARLGARSSTGDPEGEILHTGVRPAPDVTLPTGSLLQRPPAHSAVKVKGERAYRRARRGETFVLNAREVTVQRFCEIWRTDDRAAYEIECSAGTYVRSLIADLGDAYCEELRRTDIGPFGVGDAVPASWGADGAATLAARLMSLEHALAFLPSVRLDDEDARRAGHGMMVNAPLDADMAARPEAVVLLDDDGVIAIAERRPEQSPLALKPIVGFRA